MHNNKGVLRVGPFLGGGGYGVTNWSGGGLGDRWPGNVRHKST